MKADHNVPEPPITIGARAASYWSAIYEQLESDGGIETLDLYLVARYCDSLAEWEELAEFRRENEVFEKMISSKGVEYYYKNPKISRLEYLEKLLLRMEKDLGITRSARGKGGRKPSGAKAKLFKR